VYYIYVRLKKMKEKYSCNLRSIDGETRRQCVSIPF
jgi:hypothetical protein